MKSFKRILSIFLILLLSVAVFAGCDKGSKTIADPVPDKDGNITLLVGGIGALTGDYAVYGTAVKNGAQLAIDEINAAGGVNGLKFALDFQDSQGNPEAAVSAYGNLIDKGMVISLGGVMSGETSSIVAAAKDDGIFILTPSGSAKNCIEGNDNAFRLCFMIHSRNCFCQILYRKMSSPRRWRYSIKAILITASVFMKPSRLSVKNLELR